METIRNEQSKPISSISNELSDVLDALMLLEREHKALAKYVNYGEIALTMMDAAEFEERYQALRAKALGAIVRAGKMAGSYSNLVKVYRAREVALQESKFI